MDEKQEIIIQKISENEPLAARDLFSMTETLWSLATMKRTLAELIKQNFVMSTGKGKGTRYLISPIYKVLKPVHMENYFSAELDERKILQNFSFEMMSNVLKNHTLFNDDELNNLQSFQKVFTQNISELTMNEYRSEFERLAIDLSWKSAQIEGNTYSLLETERLIKEKEWAKGKTKEEAIMLLNHKEALDFIIETPDYLYPLTVSKIEDIHSILIKDLGIERNLRKSRIGITGTNYRPLDNEFQIKEALNVACELINSKHSVFEQAFLALVLISYIQPFMDGNKRTARIVSNAILINAKYCPLSFRTVDSLEYKKAMLIFYEQNNIYNFKSLFINQFQFAVSTYF